MKLLWQTTRNFLLVLSSASLSCCAAPSFKSRPDEGIVENAFDETLEEASYPLQSSQAEIDLAVREGNILIESVLTAQEKELIDFYAQTPKNGDDSFALFRGEQGFTKARGHIHKQILDDLFASAPGSVATGNANAYILAGMAGSGKTMTLARLVPKEVISINPDEMKEKLAAYDRSALPELPLSHADYLHRESVFLANEALERAILENRNILYEKTLYSDIRKTIKRMADSNYKTHLLATQIYPHIAIKRVAQRFVDGDHHRYIPLSIVAEKGNRIQVNVMNALSWADDYVIIDTSVAHEPRIIQAKGELGQKARAALG